MIATLIPPGTYGSSKSNITIFDNFIDKEDLLLVQSFIPTIDEWENGMETTYDENGVCTYDAEYWRDRMCSGDIILKSSPKIHTVIDSYIQKMKILMESKFLCEVEGRPPVLMRWRPGNEQQPHADKQLNDGSPNAFPTYDLSSLFYWNDDYEGGEIYFPQHDVEIKPKPGMAVMFPGDVNYLHGVRRIISGERWTTPSFYTVTRSWW